MSRLVFDIQRTALTTPLEKGRREVRLLSIYDSMTITLQIHPTVIDRSFFQDGGPLLVARTLVSEAL
jgi:hypothetical protein